MSSEQENSIFNGSEIDILASFGIIWRKKLFVLLACITTTFLALLVLHNMTPLYSISAIIKLSEQEKKKDGEPVYIDSLDNTMAIVNNKALPYTSKVIKDEEIPTPSLSIINKSNLLKINILYPNQKRGIAILENYLAALNSHYTDTSQQVLHKKNQQITELKNQIIDIETDKVLLLSKKQFIENDIKNIKAQKNLLAHKVSRLDLKKNNITLDKKKIQSEIEKIENNIKLVNISKQEIHFQEDKHRADINLSEATSRINNQALVRLKKEIREVEKNTRSMIKNNKNMLNAKPSQSEALTLLMYSNAIQQNLSLLDDMNTRMEKLLTSSAHEESTISKLQLDNKKLLQNIARKDVEIANIENRKQLMKMDLATKDIEFNSLNLTQADLKEKITQLDIQIDTKELDKKNLILQAKKFGTKKSNTETYLKRIQKDYNDFRPIKIISSPKASIGPVKPKKLQIIILTLFSTFIISILTILAIEVLKYYLRHPINKH